MRSTKQQKTYASFVSNSLALISAVATTYIAWTLPTENTQFTKSPNDHACPHHQAEQFRSELHLIARAYGLGAFDARRAQCIERGGDDVLCEKTQQHTTAEMQEVYYASLLFQYNRNGEPCARRILGEDLQATRYMAETIRSFGGAVVI